MIHPNRALAKYKFAPGSSQPLAWSEKPGIIVALRPSYAIIGQGHIAQPLCATPTKSEEPNYGNELICRVSGHGVRTAPTNGRCFCCFFFVPLAESPVSQNLNSFYFSYVMLVGLSETHFSVEVSRIRAIWEPTYEKLLEFFVSIPTYNFIQYTTP